MSTRHMRKVLGSTALPPPDENSDDDFVPLYTKKHSLKGAYAALELDSTPESEPVEAQHQDDEQPECSNDERKKKRNNRKNKKTKPSNLLELDEIDKSIREVNALLGEPTHHTETVQNKPDPEAILFSVQQKHLDSNNEMTRLFGPEDDEDDIRRQRQRNTKIQKNIVIPKAYAFNKLGLSMSIRGKKGDITYFAFDHSKEYRIMHQRYLDSLRVRSNADNMVLQLQDLINFMHIEGPLEYGDMLFQLEEYSVGNDILEQCIAYMQYVAHPCFSLTGRRTRLEYKYLENRPFHIALLKYAHLLTNRACHRTALEIAKALLNLDPSDPLAVIFIIDAFALRSREHKWLYDAVEYWNVKRDGQFMFNLQYSQAMCCLHLSKAKNKESTIEEANKRLRKTLLKFPYVLIQLLECCNQGVPAEIRKNHFFNEFASVSTPQPLKDLMHLYVKFTWARWKEPAVLDWLISNAKELITDLEKNVINQAATKIDVQNHSRLFQKWPEEIIRHLCVIKPLSNLIVEGAVPNVPVYTLNTNPCPPANTVNRYNYALQRQSDMDFVPALLRTIQPNYNEDEDNN
ncbi:unnamed protein product [Leptosia nina]|uniref:Transcription factor 25 n=1 Tax=Leptosia nina TaxID=320188 RepID=A0AAV1J6J4_9NEOP